MLVGFEKGRKPFVCV